jgi:hypothetical protein
MFRHGTAVFERGEANINAKLTSADVRAIKQNLTRGIPPGELATQFCITLTTISHIKLGKTWANIKT